MVIGPLYYLFTRSAIDKSFNLRTSHLLHFIPALAGMIFGFQISDGQLESLPLALFAFLFIGYYLHLLIYLGISFRLALSHRTKGLKPEVFELLKLMFYALLAVWMVYVLNILDEVVPYIIGPILYSIVAYAVSFIVFRKGYMEQIGSVKYKTTPISEEQADQLFDKTVTLVDDQKLFLNPDLTLKELSGLLKVSPQIMSMVINQKSGMNFNGFINGYRITEALRLLELEQYRNHTISSIAFEVGFNSLSSFNTSFKKQTGSTPVAYRNSLMK
jgi:AraC-like DNA-binding protein